jgi:hypothetical protein
MKGKAAVAVLASVVVYAGLDGSYVVPSDHEAIQYSKAPVDDAVAQLQKRIAAGEVNLEYHADLGYLPSVLKHLNIPESSQVLVFSKTSFQASRISPKLPRALYFNDEVSVGYVRGGDVLELAAHDPKQGVIFYILDQERATRPSLQRQDSCLQCHASGSTLGVPGMVVRSVYPDRTGMPIFQAGSFVTDHRSPLAERWGGWYVTGTHGGQKHLGNRLFAGAEDTKDPGTDGLNRDDLTGLIDAAGWLRPTSDIVALMVLEHQTRMQNLITRVGWEARMALHQREMMNKALGDLPGTMTESTLGRIHRATEELVSHLLMMDEAPLTEPIAGNSGFAEQYSARGPLYEIDGKRRLFKYGCSPLIQSRAFAALPQIVRERVDERLQELLAGEDRAELRRILTEATVLSRR